MIGWGITIAYFAAGLFYARHLVSRWSRDPDSLSSDGDSFERTSSALGALGLGLVWPFVGTFDVLKAWLWKPSDRYAARIEQLRKDRDEWREREWAAATEEERAMARDIRKTLDDILSR